MKLSSVIFSLAALMGTSALDISALKNGAYTGTVLEDGSTLVQSLDDPEAAAIEVPPPPQNHIPRNVHGVQRRFVSCWGSALDHSGVDEGTRALRDWANVPGGRTLTSYDNNNWIGFVYENTMVYYCINAKNSAGNIDLVDVDFALSEMDRNCPAYDASYYQWDGSPEIIGKASSGIPICQG